MAQSSPFPLPSRLSARAVSAQSAAQQGAEPASAPAPTPTDATRCDQSAQCADHAARPDAAGSAEDPDPAHPAGADGADGAAERAGGAGPADPTGSVDSVSAAGSLSAADPAASDGSAASNGSAASDAAAGAVSGAAVPAPASSSSAARPRASVRRTPLLSWTPDAIVFDCDGTLMDTERHWQDARELTLRDHGLRARPGFAERAKGVHYTQCGRLMADEAGRPDLGAALTDALLEHFRTLVAADPVTMPGAAELVAHAAAFAPLAVASNCPADVVETCLSTAGLLAYFDHIVVPDSAVRPKPAPDVYLTAVRLCGAKPAHSLAVEDSACGVQAAVRAGLRVLGVGPRPEPVVAATTDLWVDRLDDPDVTAWATHRESRALAH
jgi:HAD superfamily hydrolase (TIGR01509 family)